MSYGAADISPARVLLIPEIAGDSGRWTGSNVRTIGMYVKFSSEPYRHL